MPTFTPPTRSEACEDPFWGRFSTEVGVSVLWDGATYTSVPYPWLGELVNLVEGETWFQGGRTYTITPAVAAALNAAGYTTAP